MPDSIEAAAGRPPVLAGYSDDGVPDPRTARLVARAWAGGSLVGLPTETVYGLSADADNRAAVARIYRVKGRPAGHPLIVHVAGAAAVAGWSHGCDPRVAGLLARFWPGPLTVVVPRSDRAGDHITGAQDTVALRCPGHPVALAALVAFAELTGDPAAGVAAPSANRFGRVSPTTAADVLAELAPRLRPGDLVVDGGPSRVGVESTIVDCTAGHPRVLRPGAIGAAELGLAWDAGSGAPPTQPAANVRVPGTLAAHYAPRVRLITIEEAAMPQLLAQLAVAGMEPGRCALLAERAVADPPGWTRLAAPADAAGYASILYGALRRADELDLDVVVAVLPNSTEPLGRAVRDRLLRAGVGSGR